jgi:hypothetical protein
MHRAADELEDKDFPGASEHAARASDLLGRLAAGLREVHKASGLNYIDRLTEAEKQAAHLLKDLEREGHPAEQAMARAETASFANELQSLARGDAELFSAAKRLSGAYATDRQRRELTNGENGSEGQFAEPPTTPIDSLRDISVMLQRRIQEAIVSGVMQQAVGPVPPQYSEMVDEYYRVLSEDVE